MRATDREERELIVISGGQGLTQTLRLQWEERGLAVRYLSRDALSLDQISWERAALLVVDLDPPEADALELCGRLGANRAVPFIALLPRPDPDLATAVLDRGADDCLARPFNPQELSMRIQAVLRRNGSEPLGLLRSRDEARMGIREEQERVKAERQRDGQLVTTRGRRGAAQTLALPPEEAPPGGRRRKPRRGADNAQPSSARPSRDGEEGNRSYGDPKARRRVSLAFVVVGILIAASVLVTSLGMGVGVSPDGQATDEAELGRIVAPLLEQLQQDPTDEAAMVALGNAYYDYGWMEDAIPWYEKALQTIPDDTDVRTDLGTAYFYSGDSEKAKEQWSRVLEREPGKVQTHYNLAVLYLHQTPPDNEAAAREWETVVRLAPDSEEGQSAAEQLKKLRGQ